MGRRARLTGNKLKGRLAWWLWGRRPIYFLIDFRGRLAISLQWPWSCLTFHRGARLNNGGEGDA